MIEKGCRFSLRSRKSFFGFDTAAARRLDAECYRPATTRVTFTMMFRNLRQAAIFLTSLSVFWDSQGLFCGGRTEWRHWSKRGTTSELTLGLLWQRWR